MKTWLLNNVQSVFLVIVASLVSQLLHNLCCVSLQTVKERNTVTVGLLLMDSQEI